MAVRVPETCPYKSVCVRTGPFYLAPTLCIALCAPPATLSVDCCRVDLQRHFEA